MTTTEDTIIDKARLASFTGGDPEFEAELAALYLETAQLYLSRLSSALDDTAGWQRAAHALKGASANVGAVVVARLAAEHEQGEPQLQALRRLETEVGAVRELFRVRGTLRPSSESADCSGGASPN